MYMVSWHWCVSRQARSPRELGVARKPASLRERVQAALAKDSVYAGTEVDGTAQRLAPDLV